MGMLGAITGILAGGLGYASAKAKNKADMKRLQFKTEFDERMSSTAYQRGMKDMRAAGLNPILAYKQGGASAPQAAFAPTVEKLSAGLNSAMAVTRYEQEMKNLKEQEKVLQSTHDVNDENARALTLKNYGLAKDADFANQWGVSTAFANSVVGKAQMGVNALNAVPDLNLGGKTSDAIRNLKKTLGGWWNNYRNTPSPRNPNPKRN